MRVENERLEIHKAILDSLDKYNIELWNYQRLNDSFLYNSFYRDATHLSNDGAKIFTEIIRERLNKKQISP